MGELPPKSRPGRALAAWLAGCALVQIVLSSLERLHWVDRFHDRFVAIPSIEEASRLRYLVDRAFHGSYDALNLSLATALTAAYVLLGLGFVMRLLAKASVRAGHADPLDRVRVWKSAHPRWMRGIEVAVFGGWAVNLVTDVSPWNEARPTFDRIWVTANFILIALAGAAALYALARVAGAALLAPTLTESAPRAASGKDEITFDAVAVTRETRAAVGVMVASNLAMAAWLGTLSTHALYHDNHVYGVIAAFALTTLGGAALFRRGSRIAVGVDGVRVQGTSRMRFFAFRDLDAARVNGSDIELVRKDRVVLRIQLHGEDAMRRDAVLTRIRSAIDRVKEGRGAAAAQMVSAANPEQLARVAGGGADYRGAALTRDQLWALLEGPEIDAGARRMAAEALAKTSDDVDRARLRVAAEQCAAPDVRAAMERLAEEEAESEAGGGAALARRSA